MAINRPNPTRIHSLALGKYDNFTSTSAGIIAAGDSAPSVGLYSVLYANTAGALTIDNFTDSSEGQLVLVVNKGSGAVSFSGTNIYRSNSAGLAQNDCVLFIKNASKWYEISKNYSGGDEVAIFTDSATAQSVRNKSVAILAYDNTATLASLTNAYEGQRLILLATKSNVTLDHGVLFISARSSQDYVLSRSDAALLVYANGLWIGAGYPATAL